LHENPVDGRKNFFVSGEIKSVLNLMPDSTKTFEADNKGTDHSDFEDSCGYILRYTMFPQTLGKLALPHLSLTEKSASNLVLIKDFTKKVYVTNS
jgi:hypothetical protein